MKGYYDFEGIKNNVPIRDVVAYYTGQHTDGSGAIHCPDPNHNDRNPSATFHDKKNNCRCWSCNTTFNVLEVVKLNKGCDTFYEAAEILCNDFGLKDYVKYKDETPKKRSAITQVLLRKIGLDGHNLSLDEDEKDKDTVYIFNEAEEQARYDIFELIKVNPVSAYEMVISHLKDRIDKLTDSLLLVEEERENFIEKYGVNYIQTMLITTDDYMTFRQKEVDEAKAEYDNKVADEKDAYIKAGNPEKSFKPSCYFKRPKTQYEFIDNARRLIERGIAYLNDTNFIRDNRKELEAMNKSLEKIIAEYNEISPKSKETSLEKHAVDLRFIFSKRNEMDEVENRILAEDLTSPKKNLEEKEKPLPSEATKKEPKGLVFNFGGSLGEDKPKSTEEKPLPDVEPKKEKKGIVFNFNR